MKSMIIANQLYISPSPKPLGDQSSASKSDLETLVSVTKSRVDSSPPPILAGANGLVMAAINSSAKDSHKISEVEISRQLPFDPQTTFYSVVVNSSKKHRFFQLCALTPQFSHLLLSYLELHPKYEKIEVLPLPLALCFPYFKAELDTQFFAVEWNDERVILLVSHAVVQDAIPFAQSQEIPNLLAKYLYAAGRFEDAITLELLGIDVLALQKLPTHWKSVSHQVDPHKPLDIKELRPHIPIITIDKPAISQSDNSTTKTITAKPDLYVDQANVEKSQDLDRGEFTLATLKFIIPIVVVVGLLLGIMLIYFLVT